MNRIQHDDEKNITYNEPAKLLCISYWITKIETWYGNQGHNTTKRII